MGSGLLTTRRLTRCNRSDKATYPSQEAAWQGIEHVRERDPEADLAPYRCHVHKGWHIGNRP